MGNEQCFEKSRQLLLELQRQYFARQQHTLSCSFLPLEI